MRRWSGRGERHDVMMTTIRQRERTVLTINVDNPLSRHPTDHVARYAQVLAGVSARHAADGQQSWPCVQSQTLARDRWQSILFTITHSFIHSFIKPLDRRWVVVPSILLDHWLCPMRRQRRVLCRLPVVASTDGEASHVDVSTAACCRGGDQFLPWQLDAVPCGPEWLLEVVLRDQTAHDVISWSCHEHFLGQSGLWWWRWWQSRTITQRISN